MYSQERVALLKLEASPAAIWSNLSAGSQKIAYAHKEAVYLLSARAAEKRESAPLEKVPLPFPLSPITSVRFVKAQHPPTKSGAPGATQHFLVVTTKAGFSVFDGWGEKLLLRKTLAELGVPEEDLKRHSLCGITAYDATAYIGTSWGDILQVLLLSDDGEPRLLSPRFRATATTTSSSTAAAATTSPSAAIAGSSSSSTSSKKHNYPITALATTDKYLFSGDDNGGLVQWDRSKLTALQHHQGSGFPLTSLIARNDVVVAGYTSGHIRLFRAGSASGAVGEDAGGSSSSSLAVEVAAHSRCVTALDWHPKQFTFASIAEDCRLHVYSLPELASTEGRVTPGLEASFPATKGFKVIVDSVSLVKDALLCGVQFSRFEEASTTAGLAPFSTHFASSSSSVAGAGSGGAGAGSSTHHQPDLFVAAYDSHALRVFLGL